MSNKNENHKVSVLLICITNDCLVVKRKRTTKGDAIRNNCLPATVLHLSSEKGSNSHKVGGYVPQSKRKTDTDSDAGNKFKGAQKDNSDTDTIHF